MSEDFNVTPGDVVKFTLAGSLSLVMLTLMVCGGTIGCNHFNRWQEGVQNTWTRSQARLQAENEIIVARSRGQATLAQAEDEKKVAIETARAQMEVAELKAQGELDAAALRAEAIQVIGEMAQRYPEYRYQEFLADFGESIKNGHADQIIYLPTESGVPLLEAGRARQSGQ